MRRPSLATGEQVSIQPRAPNENNPSSNIVPMPDRDTEIRWNWNTPFILSRNDGVSAWGRPCRSPSRHWCRGSSGWEPTTVSRDGGASWKEVGENIPGGTRGYYISRIGASYFDAGTAYASVDGHKSDDLRPMVMDDITPLQQLTPEVMEQDAFLFEPREAVAWKENRMRSRSVTGDKVLRGDNALPGTAIHYYLADEVDAGDVSLTVTEEVFRDLDATGHEGINRVQWDLEGNEPEEGEGGGGGFGGPQAPVAEPGTYRVTLTVDGEEFSQLVIVLEDVWMGG